MLVALLGDSHFGIGGHNINEHNHFKKFYEFFFEYLDKQKIKTLVQLGDLFHVRKLVHFTTIDWANVNFFAPIKKQNIDFYVISGNHDCVFRNSNKINSVKLLCPKDTTVVDMLPQTVLLGSKTFDLYPWINSENLNDSVKFAKESSSDYAIGHFEFAGFPMHPGTIAETGMNHSLFANYEQVFSGHFHTVSQKNNILYTGTPYEMSWSDWNDPKGFWILDTETGIKEFIRNPYTLFEKISYTDGITYDFTQVNEKYVKIVVADKADQKKFDAFVDSVNFNNPYDVKIIESSVVGVVSDAVKVTDLVSTQQMLTTVIDNMDIQLDKVKLKQLVLELHAEAMVLNNTV